MRKRQPQKQSRKDAGAQYYFILEKETLAQAVAGSNLDPSIVRGGKQKLFEKPIYGQVFPSSDAYYYLCRYWLMTYVSYAARGYPERAYAKWVVLNFVWSHLSPLVQTKAGAERLREHWEYDGKAMVQLLKVNNTVFNAALKFFYLKRGTGAKKADVSTFFKRTNLHDDFMRFWGSSFNTYRGKFKKAWGSFESALAEEVE